MSEFNQELIKEATKDFNTHLQLQENSRIIFSGRYGLGKTSFLNHYFETNKDTYYTIRLAPVNYSVASNEDIFRYIKYDILRSLLSDGTLSLKDLDFTKWEALPFFLKKNFKDIVKASLRAISKLGPMKAVGIDAVYKELEGLYDKLEEFQQLSNSGKKEKSDSFINLLEEEEGSLYEYNVITELISEGLGGVTEKENVLIIDDLDRIDPEHIFRLFNVFAAHVDFKGEEGDKFGFDKIIFVCDVENIESIFHHRYGVGTDFSGYIDKFYSTKVFYFDNKNDLRRILEKHVNSIEFPEAGKISQDGSKRRIIEELLFIMEKFRVNNSYSLRNLFTKDKKYKIESKKIILNNGSDRYSNSLVSVIVIQILLNMYGDKGTLKKHFESCCKKWETFGQLIDGRLNNALLLYFIEEHKLIDGPVTLRKNDIEIELLINSHYDSGIKYASVENGQKHRSNLAGFNDEFQENMNLFRLYSGCIDTLEEKGII